MSWMWLEESLKTISRTKVASIKGQLERKVKSSLGKAQISMEFNWNR